MKLRSIFVSNSSSSSCVVLKTDIELKDITPEMVKKGGIFAFGKYELCDGEDFFRISEAIYNCLLVEPELVNELNFCFVYEYFVGGGGNLKRELLPEKCDIELFDIDHHATGTMPEFRERYLGQQEENI